MHVSSKLIVRKPASFSTARPLVEKEAAWLARLYRLQCSGNRKVAMPFLMTEKLYDGNFFGACFVWSAEP